MGIPPLNGTNAAVRIASVTPVLQWLPRSPVNALLNIGLILVLAIEEPIIIFTYRLFEVFHCYHTVDLSRGSASNCRVLRLL